MLALRQQNWYAVPVKNSDTTWLLNPDVFGEKGYNVLSDSCDCF
jgi:hypothetical protein